MGARLPPTTEPTRWVAAVLPATLLLAAASGVYRGAEPAHAMPGAATTYLAPGAADGMDAAVGLSIADNIPAFAGDLVDVPIAFAANGNSVSSLAFELDYDTSKLALKLGPNIGGFREVLSVSFPSLPVTFEAGAFVVTGVESDIEVFVHVDPGLFPPPNPLPTIPDGTVAQLTFTATGAPNTSTNLNFEQTDPVPSAGLSNGSSNPDGVTTDNGSVDIAPATQTVMLKTGFNLVGFRVVPTDPNPVAVFAPIDPVFVAAYDFNNCTTFRFYKKGIPIVTLPGIDAIHGYWVEVTADTSLTITGSIVPYPVSIPMCLGFNLIGYPSRDPVAMPAALDNSISGKWKAAFGEPFPFKFYNVMLPIFTLTQMRTGFGYWVETTMATTLTVVGP